jgi:repressor LexA
VPLLGSIPAGPISEAVAHPVEWVDPGSFLSPAPQDFFLRVHGDSMVGDGILDGDLALLRPHVKVPHGSIAAACVGEEREATLKRIYYEGEQIRFKASNPLYKDILAPAESVSFAGLLKGVMRRVGER